MQSRRLDCQEALEVPRRYFCRDITGWRSLGLIARSLLSILRFNLISSTVISATLAPLRYVTVRRGNRIPSTLSHSSIRTSLFSGCAGSANDVVVSVLGTPLPGSAVIPIG